MARPQSARARRAARLMLCGIVAVACMFGVLVFGFSGLYVQEEIRLGHFAPNYVPLCLFVVAAISGIVSISALSLGTALNHN
jgi:hypothetical protein